jgi:hypothetical protein
MEFDLRPPTMKLSPKAKLFVARAVMEAATGPLKLAARDLGTDPWSSELSPEARRVAIAALDKCRKQTWTRLGASLAEDEATDLRNDLGFIEAVCSDLQHSLNTG